MPKYRRVHFRVSLLMDSSSGTRRARAALEEHLRLGFLSAPALFNLTSFPDSLLVTHLRERRTFREKLRRFFQKR
ncbi:MAG: hypothetical protein ACP5SH_25340 [Syntrophobacteraceae bacterium]